MATPQVKDDSFSKASLRLRAALDEYESALSNSGKTDPIFTSTSATQAQKPDLSHLERVVAESAERVRNVLVNPYQEMLNFSLRVSAVIAFLIAQELDLFNLIPIGKSITLNELVRITGAEEAVLIRYLRLLTSTLRGRGFPDWIALLSGCARAQTLEPKFFAQRKYRAITDAAETPTQLAYNTKKPWFEFLETDQKLVDQFHHAMQGVQKIAPNPSPQSYPFDQVLQPDATTGALKTIVDVGGGSGHWMRAIKEAYPNLRFNAVVQDTPQNVAAAHQDKSVRGPIQHQAHDFFTPQPVKGAEIYFLSHIFHDWPSPACRQILNHLVAAMKPGRSRLIVVDAVVPEMGASRSIAAFDAAVGVLNGGMERTRQQWVDLICGADERLQLTQIIGDTDSPEQILEFSFGHTITNGA